MKGNVYIFGAGGTGGHIMPAVTVATKIKEVEPTASIVFIGVGNEIESIILDKLPFEIKRVVIPMKGFVGKGILGRISFILNLPVALCKAVKLFLQLKPKAVTSFGGYPGVIPMIAGYLTRVKRRIIQEQNGKVGKANKYLSHFATKVFAPVGVSGFANSKNVEALPNPVRPVFQRKNAYLPDPYTLRVGVVGGSQGARTLNTIFIEVFKSLSESDRAKISVIHQTGKLDFERVTEEVKDYSPQYKVISFIEKPWEIYQDLDLVICRAGALTVAEISMMHLPAIYVPLALAFGHQKDNINEILKDGGAIFVEQNDQSVEKIKKQLEEFIAKKERLIQISQTLSGLFSHDVGYPATRVAEEIRGVKS